VSDSGITVPAVSSPVTRDVSLSDLAVSEIVGDFYVRAYQRGYRWGPAEVPTYSTTSKLARMTATTCSRWL